MNLSCNLVLAVVYFMLKIKIFRIRPCKNKMFEALKIVGETKINKNNIVN